MIPGAHCWLAVALLSAGCHPARDSAPAARDSTPAARDSDTASGAAIETSLHDEIGSLVWLRWTQDRAGTTQVRYGVEGEDGLETPSWQLDAGRHEALLLGLPFDAQAWARVEVDEELDSELSFETGALPDGVPSATVEIADSDAWDPDTRFVLTSTAQQDGHALILDRQGRTVWARETPLQRMTMQPRVSHDGTRLLLDLNSFYGAFDGGLASQVVALTIDGSEQQRWDTPGLHHCFTDLPDGTMAWAAIADNSDDLMVIEPGGEQRTLWDCGPFQQGLGLEAACLSNGLSWHQDSGHYLLSLFTSHAVVEIDADTGQATRWFGGLPEAWGFATSGSAFHWQHGAHYTADGTLLLSTQASALTAETVVREYRLDEHAQALEQIWTFGEGQGVFGPEGGEAHRLGNGNTLHNYGSGSRLREITPDGEVIWDLDLPDGTYLGRTTPIADLYALMP